MQITGEGFAPYETERRVDMHIRFELLDTKARDAARPSVSGECPISQLKQITDGGEEMGGKWASLEPDMFLLDGSFELLPQDIGTVCTGWWSDAMSNADRSFATPCYLHVTFGGVAISTIGFTLCFDDKAHSYATRVRASCYAADQKTIIATKDFENDQTRCVMDMPLQNYYAVRFDFLQTAQPYRRIRLVECLFGIVQCFDRNGIQSVELQYALDPAAESFPSRELRFKFNNMDGKYNMVNPSGVYKYLQQGQDVLAETLIGGVAVPMGSFEFMSADGKDDEIIGEITANDAAIALLDQATFDGGEDRECTLQEAVASVLAGVTLPISMARAGAMVSMAIPKGTSKREALRMLAQAVMCAIWIDRGGILQIQPVSLLETACDTLTADRMASLGGISVSEPIEKLVLTVRNEYKKDINGNPRTEEQKYTAGSGKREKQVENPCVAAANGNDVATWLLAQAKQHATYDKDNRGNPAVELGDTIKIFDAYGENRNAVVTGQEFFFDGSLSANTKARGGVAL